ncbi:MAG: hypothetical protein O3C10_04210 [Chloroflexi bacterium]|nr:hypothetical protein [Chloroflexota bacterium]
MQKNNAERFANALGLKGLIWVLFAALSTMAAALTTLIDRVDELDALPKVVFLVAAFVATYVILVLAFSFPTYLFIRIKKRFVGSKGGELTAEPGQFVTPGTEMLYGWASNFVKDRGFVEMATMVTDEQVLTKSLEAPDSYIDIRFLVWNRTHLALHVGSTFDGGITYGTDALQKPEVAESISRLAHDDKKWITVRQYLGQGMVEKINDLRGQEATFNLVDLTIGIASEFPDGTAGPTGRLDIPTEIRFDVP